jgi:hypothetical protein
MTASFRHVPSGGPVFFRRFHNPVKLPEQIGEAGGVYAKQVKGFGQGSCIYFLEGKEEEGGYSEK